MPLRAIAALGTNLHAFEYDQQHWTQLKTEYRDLGLRMPCCEAGAIPKTSSRGTRFFAHAQRGECTSAPESDEHLWCKQVIATAAQSAGWNVNTEFRGQTPNGEDWIADVFCQQGKTRLAFEVQLSPQTDEELRRRQAIYKASGVRSAWFYSSSLWDRPFPHSHDLPAFLMSTIEVGTWPNVLDFNIPLPEFVAGMLTKRLRWDIQEKDKPIHVEVMEDICWACKQSVRQVYGHIEGLQIGEEPVHGWHVRGFTVAQLSVALEGLLEVVRNEELKAAGINTIMKVSHHRGKPTNWPYCNRCLHCGAPQNNHHIGEQLRAAFPGNEGRARRYLVAFSRIVGSTGRWVFDAKATET